MVCCKCVVRIFNFLIFKTIMADGNDDVSVELFEVDVEKIDENNEVEIESVENIQKSDTESRISLGPTETNFVSVGDHEECIEGNFPIIEGSVERIEQNFWLVDGEIPVEIINPSFVEESCDNVPLTNSLNTFYEDVSDDNAEVQNENAGNSIDDKIETQIETIELNSNERQFMCGVVEGFYGRPWSTEQRLDLFVKMKFLGLNTYMYAPKDDFKHRAFWRELYSIEEAEQLRSLVRYAEENDVIFFYALSPGVDITYSNSKDIIALKRKLDQVSQCGCKAFALLFDDIEPAINEIDKKVYQSFAHAQVAVCNEIYRHLACPKFIFCPTEYCAARAVPNVVKSSYLNTVGQLLHVDIDIMWTGPKVVSKEITIGSILELSEVLHRPPIIWDNIFANDYDPKRLYLGPYCGRSTELIPKLRGVLSNPNCEYEPNFVPFHTLSQWRKCTVDINGDSKSSYAMKTNIKLEAENKNDISKNALSSLNSKSYQPANALKIAVQNWLPEFYKTKHAFGRILNAPLVPTPVPLGPLPIITSCFSAEIMSSPLSSSSSSSGSSDSSYQPFCNILLNSFVTPKNDLNSDSVESRSSFFSEPLNFSNSPNTLNKFVDISNDTLSSKKEVETYNELFCCKEKIGFNFAGIYNSTPPVTGPEIVIESIVSIENGDEDGNPITVTAEKSRTAIKSNPIKTEEPEIIYNNSLYIEDNKLNVSDIVTLVELFYLPFEHGKLGLNLLEEFHWLKCHGFYMCHSMRRRNDSDNPEMKEWTSRAAKFDSLTQAIVKLLLRLTFCPNRSLLYDLYPYIWDIKGVISMLNSYLKWIALRRVALPITSIPRPRFACIKDSLLNGDQEPWCFLGGLTTELQLLLPLESVNDLFLYKFPDIPNGKIYTIRPYLHSDESHVYYICAETFEGRFSPQDYYLSSVNIIGDKLIGHFLSLSPEYCFVVEDENSICGYALAALDARKLRQRYEDFWLPELQIKYPPVEKENLSRCEEVINSFHTEGCCGPPDVVYIHHPSTLKMNILPCVNDPSVPKRMLTCILSTLKANGSHGVFVEVGVGDLRTIDFFSKLGFLEIAYPGYETYGLLYMGRAF